MTCRPLLKHSSKRVLQRAEFSQLSSSNICKNQKCPQRYHLFDKHVLKYIDAIASPILISRIWTVLWAHGAWGNNRQTSIIALKFTEFTQSTINMHPIYIFLKEHPINRTNTNYKNQHNVKRIHVYGPLVLYKKGVLLELTVTLQSRST